MYALPHLDIPPLNAAHGTIRLPGSKSISNRVLLLAGLAAGRTEVTDLLHSEDTEVMLQALAALGCGVEREGNRCWITGCGGRLPVAEADLHLANAGTAMRPLTAALALLATLHGGDYRLSGVARMHERPIGDLTAALRQLGCDVVEEGNPGYPPLRLRGNGQGRLALDAPVRVRGDVSSQFLTALLLALPLAASERAVRIEVEGELISKPYVAMTLALLQRFGVAVQAEGFAAFTIAQGARYQSPGRIAVEADASSASYFVAAGALAARDGAVLRLEGVGAGSIQGDIAFCEAVRAMGGEVNLGEGFIEARRGAWPLRAIDWDCIAIPDAAMTLAVMALYADGPTRLRGIASWRVKETDRIAAMERELRRLGATVVTTDDSLTVTPPQRWQAAAVDTYDDHRMAMALSLAAFNGLRPTPLGAPEPAAVGLRIHDPACVRKTFPDYFEALFSLVSARPEDIPVLTVDGPTASGKGTLASALASALGFRTLESGALYRAVAWFAGREGVALDDEAGLAALAARMPIRFAEGRVWIGADDVTDALRAEAIGLAASQVSALPALRQALHALQLGFRALPGLVADGRDMGTVVFPDARLKVFLTASAAERAARRHKQLISNGISANISALRADLEARDARDAHRAVSPLKPAEDAVLLDNSALTVAQSVAEVLGHWEARQGLARH